MFQYQADVRPNQPWTQDGTARVTPKPPFPDTTTIVLPLEHRAGGPITIQRSEYPGGLVIIPDDTGLSGQSAVLPMAVSSADTMEIPNGEHQSWPDGIVARFID
jgi:hypothetical protein